MADTYIVTIATNFENAEAVRQQILDATGYSLYINPDDGRLHTTATAESLEAIQRAVQSATGFQVYSQEGRYNVSDNTFEIGGETSVTEPVTEGSDTTPEIDPFQEVPGVWAGGETIRVPTDDGLSRYYQIYEYPPGSGNFMAFQYNDRDHVIATLGEDYSQTSRTQSWFDQNVLVEASAEEVIGPGSFQRYTSELMQDAATQAGFRDPTLAGIIANDPEMQQIMVQAIAGDWSAEQVLAAQRQTSFWQDELYPGIDRFYGRTTDPEAAWVSYSRSITPALRALGYEPDASGTFNTQIEEMLDLNIDADVFLSQVPVFIQAEQNAQYATVLNAWAERELGREVEFNDWFDLVAGEAPLDLEQVAEDARLAYNAQQQGTALTDDQISALARQTDLSEAEARAVFSSVNQAVMALGDRGLARGGLTTQDILDAEAGVGGNVDEVKRKVAKLAREEALFDDDKINFYVGYDPLGRPYRPGLAAVRPEGG